MAQSSIMNVVRGVTGYDGYIYNDKLKGGGRSIKVGIGTNTKLIGDVKAALEAAGYTVKIVKGYKFWEMDTHRLHVK